MPAVLQRPGAVKKIEVFLKTLHPKQEEIRQSGAKRKVVKAGRRSGKTFGLAEISVEKFLQAKRVLYAVPTVEQLDKWWFEVTGALRPAVEAGGFYKNETEHFIEKRGTTQRIKGKTAWNPDTLRGDWADLLILDEWQLFDERTWDEVGAPMLLDNDGDAIFLFTPPSMVAEGMSKARDPRHASKLYLKAKTDTTGRWQAFHFTSFDNPHLSKAALDEIATDMSRESFRKEIMADDDELPDHMMVYRAFNAKTQIVPDMVIPAGWPVYCGHDFGSANPAAVFLAQNPETGCFFLFKEYLPGGGKSTLQHVQAWQELLRGKVVVRRAGGSHQEDEIRQGYAAHGWPIMEPLHRGKPATVKAGIDRVVNLMEQNKLFIFQSCTQTLAQVLSYAYKLDPSGAVTEEIENKAKFHLCDALRYIVGDFTPESEGGVRVVSTQVTTGGYQVEVNSPLRVVSTSHA